MLVIDVLSRPLVGHSDAESKPLVVRETHTRIYCRSDMNLFASVLDELRESCSTK